MLGKYYRDKVLVLHLWSLGPNPQYRHHWEKNGGKGKERYKLRLSDSRRCSPITQASCREMEEGMTLRTRPLCSYEGAWPSLLWAGTKTGDKGPGEVSMGYFKNQTVTENRCLKQVPVVPGCEVGRVPHPDVLCILSDPLKNLHLFRRIYVQW